MVEGVRYLTAGDLIRELGISRQTLWRWRQQGRIPQGARYRERALVFTDSEVAQIRTFAERLIPADSMRVATRKRRSA
jgi:predicted DNA-binding transcriptional regulator AlpA